MNMVTFSRCWSDCVASQSMKKQKKAAQVSHNSFFQSLAHCLVVESRMTRVYSRLKMDLCPIRRSQMHNKSTRGSIIMLSHFEACQGNSLCCYHYQRHKA